MATRTDNTGFPGVAVSSSAAVFGYEVRIPDPICEMVEWLPNGPPDAKKSTSDFTGDCRAFLQSHGHVIIDWHKGSLYGRAERFHQAASSPPLRPHQLTPELQSALHILAFSWQINIRQQSRKKGATEAVESRFHIPAQLGRVAGIPRGDGATVAFESTPTTLHMWAPSAISVMPSTQYPESLGAILDRAISALEEM
jgi:hypothetical protein